MPYSLEKNPLFVEANEEDDQDWRKWKLDDDIVSTQSHDLVIVADLTVTYVDL